MSFNTITPSSMKALVYSQPEHFEVKQIPVPKPKNDEVMVKIAACGVCGTDLHYHKGEFMAKYPLIPGHEAAGTVVALGSSVKSFQIGDRVAADPMHPCGSCFYCQRTQPLMCENLTGYGGNAPGGFAEYCAYPSHLLHNIGDIPFREAILIEPAACALHGMERMCPRPGSRALLFGCGPTGILLAQLMRMNGVAHLTIASLPGPKLDMARKLAIADDFVSISPINSKEAMSFLLAANPYGFDIVVEATGSVAVLEQSILFVRKAGTLVVYGVYDEKAKVGWSPSRLWLHEITVLASFCSTRKFPEVLEYLRAGRLRLDGIVTDTFRLEEWGEVLGKVERQEVVKGAIVFE
ncbi:hypothetical protein KVT40_008944 [Elsinoe batatas]|uniref:Enoyl reductase (ER) domain-containing protein n=1 Tax=Elsinoe batatas TaxID=2601811 RepID=A0A8K0PE99_9PEZI|nr:hypothetical protein KVT40_008944 [Elsinoe batatas]